MKPIAAVLIGAFLALMHGSAALGQNVSITIDQVTADRQITGYVRGLAPADHRNYKVLVYVHTDQWYIHPYAGQDEGQSWAAIRENGVWQIQTVRREFKAGKMAAILVAREYPEPSRLERIERIPHTAITVRELYGTPDFGKL